MTDEDRAKQLDEIKAKIVQHWTALGGTPKCPMCASDGWTVLPSTEWRLRTEPLKAIPVVVLVCGRCSFLAPFSAIGVGAVSRD